MNHYTEHARRHGVTLQPHGPCQLCGADYPNGVHDCVQIFSISFQHPPIAPLYTFLVVDAHALQHPELHGRWSNHFHLTRLHLIFNHHVPWDYPVSVLLSKTLDAYKAKHPNCTLTPPPTRQRGPITASHVQSSPNLEDSITQWAQTTLHTWGSPHPIPTLCTTFLRAHPHLTSPH